MPGSVFSGHPVKPITMPQKSPLSKALSLTATIEKMTDKTGKIKKRLKGRFFYEMSLTP